MKAFRFLWRHRHLILHTTHTDIQARFVRAEVIGWRDLLDAGGYAGARELGILRTEGRDYVVADGDVITIRF